MIKKIISGGQTGADQAALDVAIKLDIPHGGWITKGRKTEKGTLPEKYQLQEMPTGSYAKQTEQNVSDSDGTLIISHGKFTSASVSTQELAEKHGRPLLQIDLKMTAAFEAARTINSWIIRHGINVLNVTGPQASKDPKIYQATLNILEAVIYMGLIERNMPISSHNPSQVKEGKKGSYPPQSVDEALSRLISELSLKDKTIIANMREKDLVSLHLSLGEYIRNKFELLAGNGELMKSCRSVSGKDDLNEDDASAIIIKKLREKLRETHILRVVK